MARASGFKRRREESSSEESSDPEWRAPVSPTDPDAAGSSEDAAPGELEEEQSAEEASVSGEEEAQARAALLDDVGELRRRTTVPVERRRVTLARTNKDLKTARLRSGWRLIRQWYGWLPEWQRERLGEMGFRHFLDIPHIRLRAGLLSALGERWHSDRCVFITRMGAFTPTLEDVVRLTGMRVHGKAVTGEALADYTELTMDCFGAVPPPPDKRSRRVTSVRHIWLWRTFGPDGQEPAADRCPRADQELRAFLLYFFGTTLFSTAASVTSLIYIQLLRDLDQVGTYAWGAAALAHLYVELSTFSEGQISLGGFLPFLQFWCWEHFLIQRPTPVVPSAVIYPRGRMWVALPMVSEGIHYNHILGRGDFERLDETMVTWRPYREGQHADEPEVAQGHRLFFRDIYIHAFHDVVMVHVSLVLGQFGRHQRIPPEPFQCVWRRLRGGAQHRDFPTIHRHRLTDWAEGGRAPIDAAGSEAAVHRYRRWMIREFSRFMQFHPQATYLSGNVLIGGAAPPDDDEIFGSPIGLRQTLIAERARLPSLHEAMGRLVQDTDRDVRDRPYVEQLWSEADHRVQVLARRLVDLDEAQRCCQEHHPQEDQSSTMPAPPSDIPDPALAPAAKDFADHQEMMQMNFKETMHIRDAAEERLRHEDVDHRTQQIFQMKIDIAASDARVQTLTAQLDEARRGASYADELQLQTLTRVERAERRVEELQTQLKIVQRVANERASLIDDLQSQLTQAEARTSQAVVPSVDIFELRLQMEQIRGQLQTAVALKAAAEDRCRAAEEREKVSSARRSGSSHQLSRLLQNIAAGGQEGDRAIQVIRTASGMGTPSRAPFVVHSAATPTVPRATLLATTYVTPATLDPGGPLLIEGADEHVVDSAPQPVQQHDL